ncbi:hypothetical protein BCR44DRAFT_1502784 [Catenaria anguillulae PL171]|uniref:HTH La-type RNA-binding domain-containing protein n=1 Tax=Catenaria anguillulae PL171 TaxID=765915 RepID=A0A1Y2H9Z6_9FUNG|nr:hypothetical protein BCR44DRAFT_1502784 [Catenaria anguillulae PL171]
MATDIASSSRQLATKLSLRRLLEFYFGEKELRTLYTHVKETIARGSWIPLHLLSKYSRVRKLSTNVNVLLGAVHESSLLEANQEATHVRRRDGKVPEDVVNELVDFTALVVSDIPLLVTQDELLGYFSNYGSVKDVSLVGRGKAVIQFEDGNGASNAMAQSPHTYNGEAFTRKVIQNQQKRTHDESTIDDVKKPTASAPSSATNSAADAPRSADETLELDYKPMCLLLVQKLPDTVTKSSLKLYFGRWGSVKGITFISSTSSSADSSSSSKSHPVAGLFDDDEETTTTFSDSPFPSLNTSAAATTHTTTAVIQYTDGIADQIYLALFPTPETATATDKDFAAQFPRAECAPIVGQDELAFYAKMRALADVKRAAAKNLGKKGKGKGKAKGKAGVVDRIRKAAESAGVQVGRVAKKESKAASGVKGGKASGSAAMEVDGADERTDVDEAREGSNKRRRVQDEAVEGLMAGLFEKL